jgi:N-acetylneuraminic acid mutarotase
MISEDYFVFGGQKSNKSYPNDIFKFDFDTATWEKLITEGRGPEGRCGSEIRAIDNNTLVVIGGMRGFLHSIEKVYNDIFLYNISKSSI